MNSGLQPNLIQADNLSIPFKQDIFDQVVSTFPTAVIFQKNSIAEIARVLKPGGKLLILPMVFITGKNLAHKLLNWLYRITGQSLPIDKIEHGVLKKYFEPNGFTSDLNLIECDGYTLLIIEAILEK